ncbi:MAG: tRNA pseudouridine(38-40) synthase TruA [Chromatiales bacterium]|nr:tRNA pseudouridine(38-40) synthase TruA [Chromatiales bacterium]
MTGFRRLVLGLEYDGSAYNGWQRQGHAPSIQAAVDAAFASVADAPVSSLAAGRTDAGVHALDQVVHLDTVTERDPRAWLMGANSHLPADISVRWVRPAPEGFHARHSALSRSYRYLVLCRPVRPALARLRAWWVRRPLDVQAMARAGELLLGEHDFSAFRAAGCQSTSPVRRLLALTVERRGELLVVDCRANGFLYHMVRNIVGSLVAIGLGERDLDWLAAVFASRDRRLAAPTAPAQGLYLARVEYPHGFDFPAPSDAPGDL